LRYNEFIEAIVRLAKARARSQEMTVEYSLEEAVAFFMEMHFKFSNGGNALEGHEPEIAVETYSQVQYAFC